MFRRVKWRETFNHLTSKIIESLKFQDESNLMRCPWSLSIGQDHNDIHKSRDYSEGEDGVNIVVDHMKGWAVSQIYKLIAYTVTLFHFSNYSI